jgi:hypothetical protein
VQFHRASNAAACRRHRPQRGYLLEIPILLAAVTIVVAVLLPMLPPIGQRVLVALAAVPVLFCLYYMIVTPGWMPGQRIATGALVRWMLFMLLAVGIVAGVSMFLLA